MSAQHPHDFRPTTCQKNSRELTAEMNTLNNQLAETENRVRSESSNLKNKLNMDVTDLVMVLDEQDRVTQDLAKTIKSQKRQIEVCVSTFYMHNLTLSNLQDLQLNMDAGHSRYGDALDMIEEIKRKANQLCRDVDAIRLSAGKWTFEFWNKKF